MDKRGRTGLKQGMRETVRNLLSARVWFTIAAIAIICDCVAICWNQNEEK